MLGNGTKKIEKCEKKNKNLKSIVAKTNIKKGDYLLLKILQQKDHLMVLVLKI